MYSDDIYNEMKCGSVCKVRNSVLMLLYGNYPVFSSRTAVGKKLLVARGPGPDGLVPPA